MNLGALAEQAGNQAEAAQAYADALTLRPAWALAYYWRVNEFRAATLGAWREAQPAPAEPTLAALEAALEANPHEVLPYTRLAEAHLALDNIPEATELSKKASQATSIRDEDLLELMWLEAKLAAAESDWDKATEFGEQAVDGYRQASLFGPGSFGRTGYAALVFRREAMRLDLVPQLEIIRITDPWAARMAQLAEWHAALGDGQRVAKVYQEILYYVPDNTEARNRLIEMGAALGN